jgi:hypothetical protein
MRLPVAAAVLAAACSAADPAEGGRASRIPVQRPTVVAVYAVPPDSLVVGDDDIASLYDDYMYYWSESRPRLNALGADERTHPLPWNDRRFEVHVGRQCWLMSLPEGQHVAYLLAAPRRAPRLIPGVLVDEDLADSMSSYMREPRSAEPSDRC